jgi:hypothetical protein
MSPSDKQPDHVPMLRRERRTRLLIAALCAPMIIGGGVLTSSLKPGTARPPLTLGNVSEANLVEIRNHANVTVLSGEFRARKDTLGNTERDAALVNRQGKAVIGEVELEVPAPGREDRRPELEVDIIGLAPRETFSVVIDDRIVGSFTTDDRGSVDMELQEGEFPGIGLGR